MFFLFKTKPIMPTKKSTSDKFMEKVFLLKSDGFYKKKSGVTYFI